MTTIQPIRRYNRPKYPDNDYLLEHPELLKLVPKRWRGNSLVLATLGAVAFLLTASKALEAHDDQGGPLRQPNSRIAPIFAHGDGVGSYGCMSVAPPVYLSEAEAQAIIRNEAAKAGINFKDTATHVKGVRFPYLCMVTSQGKNGETCMDYKDSVQTIDLTLDGVDDSLDVGFEYVSGDDHNELDFTWSGSTVETSDIKQTAVKLQKGLEGVHGRTKIGVFYDPVTYDYSWSYNPNGTPKTIERPSDAEKESRELLRAQVRDFIQWLKAQGVI